MRLKLRLTPFEDFAWSEVNQGLLVGLVWNIIRETPYAKLHDQKGFKFFTFSELFPFGDFKGEEPKYLILSSSDKNFIEVIKERLADGVVLRLGQHPVLVEPEKSFKLRVSPEWQTGSPVVLRKPDDTYWTPRKGDTLAHFIIKLTRNAVEKYRAFYGEKIELPGPLFERYELVKSVAHSFWKSDGNRVLIIGSKWNFGLPPYWKEYKKFYAFIMEAGLGEKNSMGYGFVNPVRGGRG